MRYNKEDAATAGDTMKGSMKEGCISGCIQNNIRLHQINVSEWCFEEHVKINYIRIIIPIILSVAGQNLGALTKTPHFCCCCYCGLPSVINSIPFIVSGSIHFPDKIIQ